VCRSVLQCASRYDKNMGLVCILQGVAVYFSMLRSVAVRCSAFFVTNKLWASYAC